MGRAGLIAAAAGGAIMPPAPTLTYGTPGSTLTVTITNYDATLTYAVASTVGTVSRSGAVITVSGLSAGVDVRVTVTAFSRKGGLNVVGGSLTDRMAYTYHDEYIPYTQYYNPCGDCRTDVNPHSWSCGCVGADAGGGQWGDCICRGPGYTIYGVRDATPSGYSDSGSDWFRVVTSTVERTPYTYTTVGPVESYSVSSCCCPDGWNYEYYNEGAQYCRRYVTQKDPTPSGYTDSGVDWYRVI